MQLLGHHRKIVKKYAKKEGEPEKLAQAWVEELAKRDQRYFADIIPDGYRETMARAISEERKGRNTTVRDLPCNFDDFCSGPCWRAKMVDLVPEAACYKGNIIKARREREK